MDDPRLASMSPDELRRAMRTLGYETQSDLAAAIGVSRSTVSLWLDGKVGVPRPVAMLLRMLVAAQRRRLLTCTHVKYSHRRGRARAACLGMAVRRSRRIPIQGATIMANDAGKILKAIKDGEIEWVDLRFTDPKGKWQHLSMCAGVIGEDELTDGLMFDGSSIAGWKAINEIAT